MLTIQPVKGTRDFYPADMAIRLYIFSVWRSVVRRFGYVEYDGPFLEPYELFAAKSGKELVDSQMYVLTDRGDRKLGIRPEMTPTLARMVAAKRGSLDKPLRWFSVPVCWRYEKPQKGRVREFAQLNVDLLGVDSALADAEAIAVGVEILKAFGFTSSDVSIRVNNRYFMERVLTSFGIDKAFMAEVFNIIDKKERVTQEEFVEWLNEAGLTNEQVKKLTSFLEQKSYGDDPDLTRLFEALSFYGVSEFVEFDPVIVRGIAYYTGTVFEAFDRKKEFRAIFAGGRYDDLVEVFGGDRFPGVGFGFGEVVLLELLTAYNKLPVLPIVSSTVLVTVFDETLKSASFTAANTLRHEGVNTEVYLQDARLDKQISYANRHGIPYVLIIGPDEAKNKVVTLKNLADGVQKTDTLLNIATFLLEKS